MKRLTFTTTVVPATAAVATALLLSACGGGATASGNASSTPSTPSAGSAATAPGGAGARRAPGTTGLIAAVSGSTMQVQTRTEQIAVTFTSSTAITKTVAGTAASVTVGSCVMVRDDSGATTSPVAATAVTVSAPVKGKCRNNAFGAGAGAGFGGGARPGAGGGGAAQGAPTGRPTGGPGGPGGAAGRFGGGVVGTVTAVQGATLTVTPFVRAGGTGGASGTAGASPTSEGPVTVATTATTAWTVVQDGAASDVKVGECVTALGKADDTGTVAATSLSLRPAVDGACTFGRGGPGGGPGGGAGATPTAAGNA